MRPNLGELNVRPVVCTEECAPNKRRIEYGHRLAVSKSELPGIVAGLRLLLPRPALPRRTKTRGNV